MGVIRPYKKEVNRTNTRGINQVLLNIAEVSNILFQNKVLRDSCKSVKTILFYGAGCGNIKGKSSLHKILTEFFPNAKVDVEEDLMADVHGTTIEPGVVCILGTGSNCCYYDGQNIKVHQASLGYMVMDEGSGNYFGKKLLNAYFYNKMPEDLTRIIHRV